MIRKPEKTISIQKIEAAAQIIRSGGLVAFPTETVYGLGANALDAKAVAQIFVVKERPAFDPLIVHICQLNDLFNLCKEVDDRALTLANAFWPGPLTIILPKSDLIPSLVTSGLPDVALRMPNHEVALKLIEAAGCPIAAPSANKFGKLSPTKAVHVKKQLPEVNCILDGGNCSIGLESTVVKLNEDGFVILRHGAITESMLLKYVPKSSDKNINALPEASPGLMKSHYSPEKRVYIIGEHTIPEDTSNAALINFHLSHYQGFKIVENLSKDGDLMEAAVNLFQFLHHLEDQDISFLVVEPVPEVGIGIAIMDRLRKAAFRFHNDIEMIEE